MLYVNFKRIFSLSPFPRIVKSISHLLFARLIRGMKTSASLGGEMLFGVDSEVVGRR
jgi:hypothetical protein